MKASIRSLRLARGAMHRIVNGRGWQIHVAEGELWLTQDHDERDHLVRSGESFTVERDGTTLACAMRPAVITLSAPRPTRGWLARLWRAVIAPLAELA